MPCSGGQLTSELNTENGGKIASTFGPLSTVNFAVIMEKRSQIPQPTRIEKTDRQDPHSKWSTDPEAVHVWLNEFGGPRLTVEELSRLTHGPLAEILAFIVKHVRGRREVAAARCHIHQER